MSNLFKGRLLFSFILLLLIMYVVACGAEEAPIDNGAEDPDAIEEERAEDETEDQEEDTSSDGELSGTLEIQYFVGVYCDAWWKDVIADLQAEYPNLEIIKHAGPNNNEDLRPRWVSGNPPEVVYTDRAGSSEPQMVEDGQ